MDLTCYNSYYEVNLSVLEENFKKISRFIAPAQVIPVLKADAYGMGRSGNRQSPDRALRLQNSGLFPDLRGPGSAGRRHYRRGNSDHGTCAP